MPLIFIIPIDLVNLRYFSGN